ncbi:MAG: hypothetical protein Q7U53_17570 [Anaerolineaceae bacterium]|nr:hypothetical protein [Anaerolineaceae bacterium]
MKLTIQHIIKFTVILVTILLISCGGTNPTPLNEIEEIKPEVISLTYGEIEESANCWLQTVGKKQGYWFLNKEGSTECTVLARELTDAPGYGVNAKKEFLGGLDYIKLQEENGNHKPLLFEVKDEVKACDNLVLFGDPYASVGHTVVVFHPDLENDNLYYLDQNFGGEGIRLRELRISENENNAYVISANCEVPIPHSCELVAENSEEPPITIQPLEIDNDQIFPTETAQIIEDIGNVNSQFSNIIEEKIGSWLIRFNQADWEYSEINSGPFVLQSLESKKVNGCILEPIGLGHGVPMHWQKQVFSKDYGSANVNIELWSDPNINKPSLIIYDYPPFNGDVFSDRLSVLLYHEILKVGVDIDACIHEIDKVIMESVNY